MNPTVAECFPSAATSPRPSQAQIDASCALHAAVVTAAKQLDELAPNSRDKSLAFTALEDVLMRGNRAIFNPPKEHA